jgi:hypothetical protein
VPTHYQVGIEAEKRKKEKKGHVAPIVQLYSAEKKSIETKFLYIKENKSGRR